MTTRGLKHRLLYAACFLGISVVCTLAVSGTARGKAPATYNLNIESAPLDVALQEFARQSGIQIIFFSRLTEGLRAPALQGRYTLPEALGRLLEGSKLTFRVINAKTVEIRSVPPTPSEGNARAPPPRLADDAATSRLKALRGGKGTRANPDEMAEVVINGSVEGLVATRTETPLRDIPQSVSIISSQQIREQNDTDFAGALTHAMGITAVRTSSRNQKFYSRGFQITLFHIDGGAAVSSFDGSPLPIYGTPDLMEFERIEVLRGSDSLFAGNGNPGATVNLVRKRPLDHYELGVSASAGSWNNYRVETDVTGPLALEGALRGRLATVYGDRNYFFDTAYLRKKKVFGVMDLDVAERSRVTVGGSYEWNNALPFENGLPRFPDGSDAHLPRSTGLTFDWARYDTRAQEFYAQFERSFLDDWKLRMNATSLEDRAQFNYGGFDSHVDPVTGALPYGPTTGYSTRPNTQHQFVFDATLTGAFEWRGRPATFAIGGDYARFKGNVALASAQHFASTVSNAYAYDAGLLPDPQLTSTPVLEGTAVNVSYQSGVFASANVHLSDAFSVTAGARISRDRGNNLVALTLLGASATQRSESHNSGKFTPFLGLMYSLTQRYSLYASYADIYLSNGPSRRIGGDLLAPADGVNIEAGLKGAWRNGALNGAVALYRIRQHGLSVGDESATVIDRAIDLCCYVPIGLNESKGLDAELSGQLARGHFIGAGYTYNLNHARFIGDLSSSTPRHLLKLWTSNALPGRARRVSVGGNLLAQSSNFVEGFYCPRRSLLVGCLGGVEPFRDEQAFFVAVDLRAAYQLDAHWQAAVSVNNAFDRSYYQTIGSPGNSNWYGEPRNVLLRIDGRF